MKRNTFQQKFLNEKGQAIFEMILFLPFLLFLYTIYYTAGNALSGSINQQKAVRGYFYAFVKGNSYINSLPDLNNLKDKGMKTVGFNALGWTDHLGSQRQSFAPCFKFSSLLRNNSTEECEGSDREEPGSSRYIRVFTFYGVCGPTYTWDNSRNIFIIDPRAQGLVGSDSCVVSRD